jgi:hypothetical protein
MRVGDMRVGDMRVGDMRVGDMRVGDVRVGDMRVLSWHDGMLLSLTYKLGTSAGSPNAFVERTLDVPATTRVWNTVVRLVRKHAPTPGP